MAITEQDPQMIVGSDEWEAAILRWVRGEPIDGRVFAATLPADDVRRTPARDLQDHHG